MEDNTNSKSLISRKKDARSLFKKCFKNSIFSFVPYEIWRDIVSCADLQSIAILSQTCHAFEDLVDNIGENNFNLALLFRKEGQIILARKYLFKCANNNDSTAMFHLGYAFYFSGWGLKEDNRRAAEWFKKSAECGDAHAMALYANCLRWGDGTLQDDEMSNDWACKALQSSNNYAVGYCHYFGLGTVQNYVEAVSFFEVSAEESDQFGQYMYGECFCYGFGLTMDKSKSFFWFLKSAVQGLASSAYRTGCMYYDGKGCEQNKEMGVSWLKKAANQGHKAAQVQFVDNY